MLNALLKIAAPLVLLLGLVILAGAASAAASLAGKAEANHCCEKEAEEQAPSNGGECTDPGCGCLSCSASLLSQTPRISPSISEYRPPLWTLIPSIPSPPGRSIDYPPEAV
jgi:hypothetical protein